MTVSGRSYTRTRPRGFAPWSPQRKTVVLLDQIRAVLDEYREHLPLTARQVFYRLVGRHGYDKTENSYARLCETLNRARRAGMVAMYAIRDDGTTAQLPPGFSSPADFWHAVQATADNYRPDLSTAQATDVEIWVEAAGMVPQIVRVAHGYGAAVYSSGGFDSVTAKYEAANRIARCGRPTVVLHIGDYDPSGLAILDSVAEDVAAFVRDLGGPAPRFARLAVTPEQITRYELPTAPQKATDRRGEAMSHTVQAEALSPDQIAAKLRLALEAVIDLDLLAATRRAGSVERDQILHTLDGIEINP